MKSRALLTTLTGVAMLAGTTMVMADPVIWDNGSVGAGSTALSSQLDTAYPFNSQTADDFLFSAGSIVTDVHWSGTYFNGAALGDPGPAFNIYIYADAGGTPTGGPGDPSGTALASYNTGVGGAGQVASGTAGFFDYNYNLTTPFVAAAGVHYWIAIQSINTFPPQWGWGTSTGPAQLNNAKQGFPLLGINYWTDVAPAHEMAFQLTGTPLPAPGVLALLGMAGMVGTRRRRA